VGQLSRVKRSARNGRGEKGWKLMNQIDADISVPDARRGGRRRLTQALVHLASQDDAMVDTDINSY
jgi:hypothetical protein